MKILITGGKTATALKLIKAFDQASIILGDYGDAPSIKVNTYEFASLGPWNAEVLAHNLLTKCLDYGVEVLLPLYEAEIKAVSKSLLLFEEFGLKVLVPENPLLSSTKFTNWCVFDLGEMIYTSAAIPVENSSDLNGVYSFDVETGSFALISIADPK
ncbi:ATP-grasp domain-containing protein [Pedobacter chitinilyticus]|uniref:ATP-grasp domain-containing protein n=1 Tax=Pedobacter chitinilyticus TaxID=2233776 RepID=A0A3S3PS39_9SPHI|nr:hypothetical protein [Pedobacter chitinilyticus]RWU03909.1 hypothetical protein DPV69_19685 [Pedobacter chitinilyticus]